MSKVTLADAIKNATGCTGAQAKEAVDEVTESIAKSLKKEGKFSIVGFGTFNVVKRGKRKARNPRTGEIVDVKASKSVRFKPSQTLKSRM